MNVETLKNENDEYFYPLSHARSTLYNEKHRTVYDAIERMIVQENEIIENDINIQVAGIITESSKLISLTLPIGKFIDTDVVSKAELVYLVGGIRLPDGGYIDGIQSEQHWETVSSYKFDMYLFPANGCVRISISKTTDEPFYVNGTTTKVVNNTPVSGSFKLCVKFTK